MNIPKEKLNDLSSAKNIIGIMSGKGGVGKSSVTSLLAVYLTNKGYKVGILDADITGPSIPKVFGINKKRMEVVNEDLYPVKTVTGIKVASINLMIDKEDSPIIWRGPLIASNIRQLFTNLVWEELDYLLIDLPPGTGDVPLTVMQSIDLTGLVVVSSPQSLVNLIVKKSINMANMMNIPILGLVENMSYLKCPDCEKEIKIFGNGISEDELREYNVKLIGRLPLDLDYVELCDEGKIELFPKMSENLDEVMENIINNIIK